MAEGGDLAAAMAAHRRKRDRAFRAVKRLHEELMVLQESDEFEELTAINVEDRGTEYGNLVRRLIKQMEALEEEEDEDLIEADEVFQKEHTKMYEQVTRVICKLTAIKKVESLLSILEKQLAQLELQQAAEPDKEFSSCFKPLDRLAEQIQKDRIDAEHDLTQQADALTTRMLQAKAARKPDVKPAVISSAYSKNFDMPRVGLPNFDGELTSWAGFWGRYKPAVHENEKLTESIKMAVLMDLVKDPGITEYLMAANDGKPGRYDEAIRVLMERYNRPRQVHQIYCQQLVNLPPIQGTSAEISRSVDTVFSAVTGLRGSEQGSTDYIATSLVASILPEQLRTEWESKTEDIKGVPHIDKWIAFMRKKATKASQQQKVVLQPAETPQLRYPKDKKKRPTKEGKVYASQGEATSNGDHDYKPSRSKSKQPKAAGYGRIQCTLCNSAHHVFQCKDMTVTQRREHTQGASLCFNCLRTGHAVKDCQSSFRCRLCKKTHNTLLHTESTSTPATVNHVVLNSQGSSDATPPPQQKERLLMTSQVYLTTSEGEKIPARAMLDSGAAISVLSSRMMTQLHLPKTKEWMTVSGVESQKNSPARPTANITVSSITSAGWNASVKVVILPKVTVDLPRHDLTAVKKMPHLQGLALADPHFHQPRRVDLILDSDVFDEILLPRKIEGPPATPSAWETRLGWAVMGRYLISQTLPAGMAAVSATTASSAEEDSLNTLLERFWKLEELPMGTPALSSQDLVVQKHYDDTHRGGSRIFRGGGPGANFL